MDLPHATHLLEHDGIAALRSAFPTEWVDAVHADVMTAFWSAIQRPGGAASRGPRRWYVELHPEELTGFAALAGHPWFVALCEAVLGPKYELVELGLDVAFQGARYQPWHRGSASPRETYAGHRLTSLAFDLACVDVTDDMGPIEVAPGTQWEDGRGWEHEQFPPESEWRRYASQGVKKYPRRGDLSARSALTVHRGTAHPSPVARPVVVLGVDAPGAGHAQLHDLRCTREYYEALPEVVKDHLVCRVVDALEPVTQRYELRGLERGVDAHGNS